MTKESLIAAGFKEFKPSSHDHWDMGYQLRVRDERGTRYFINVYFWRHSKHSRPGDPILDGWEVDVYYNDGCLWMPRRIWEGKDQKESAAMQIKAWAGVESWEPEDVVNWARELWLRLNPSYYELDGE